MSKKLISLLLVLIISATVIVVGGTSAFAAANTTITVGSTNYTASVGDIVTYRVAVTYPEAKIATAQVELPVNFTFFEGPSQDDLDSIFGSNDDFAAYRYDTANTKGIVGYVGNYVSFNGLDCSTSKTIFELSFKVIKAGSTNLHVGFRYVSDVNDKDIVNHKGTILENTGFTYTESLTVTSGSVKLSGSVTSYLDKTEDVTVTLSDKETGEVITPAFVGKGNTLNYSFDVEAFNTYTLTVSKKNHVDRSYDVTVNEGDVTQNMKICPLGDANLSGSVTSSDANTVYKHVLGTPKMTDPYAIKCADANKSNSLTSSDCNSIYKHVLGTKKLY